MTEDGARQVIAQFLADCPQWKGHVRESIHGQLLSTAAVAAFSRWAVKAGLAKQEKAKRVAQMIDFTIQSLHPERQ